MSERKSEPTIADFLAGRTATTPLMKITAGQRLYYNYRCGGQASVDAEVANAAAHHGPRDFRTEREP
jgi:hypothetical protein